MKVIKALGLVITAYTLGFVGCKTLMSIDGYNNSQDDADLARCRNAGREAKDAGRDAADAYQTYMQCTAEAGLR